ncbi:hypothetical protein GVAV_000987 [Gurleya vavrai]
MLILELLFFILYSFSLKPKSQMLADYNSFGASRAMAHSAARLGSTGLANSQCIYGYPKKTSDYGFADM